MFNKVLSVFALIVAASAEAFTANMASGFRRLHGKNKEPEIPFTTADIPRISGLFAMFDADSNSSIEPKEIWAMYQSMKDATPEARMEFMNKMDSGMRTFCGVPQKPVSAVPVSRRLGGKGKGGKGKGGKKGGRKCKMGKKMKMMMKKANGMMWGLGGKMKVSKVFAPFSKADTNGDMKVSPIEMGVLMNKKSKKMCKKYKKEQMRLTTMKRMEAGMPAKEVAKMKAKRAKKMKKMEARKAKMMKKWSEIKDKCNSKKDNKRGGRKGGKGRGKN